MILSKYQKQPNETLDYDIDYTDFFDGRADTLATVTAAPVLGLTISTPQVSGLAAKLVISGGAVNQTYKVTVVMTTTLSPIPVVKEDEFFIKIKEI